MQGPAGHGHDPPAAPAGGRVLRRVAGLACGLALVAALFAFAHPADVVRVLADARWELVGLAVVSYALFFALRGVRWRLLLGPGGAGAGAAALSTAAGWLVSTFVPMKAGDVVRAAWMGRRHRSGFAAASGSVALERLLDLGGLAVACTLALVLLRADGDAVPGAFGEAVAIAWLLPALGLVAIITLGAVVTPERRRNALLRFAGRALDQARLLLERPVLWLPVGALTAAIVLAQSLVYVFLILALVPSAPPVLVLAGAPLFLLSFGIALTPGHLGTYEAAFVVVFSSLGLGSVELVPVAFAVHLLTVSIVTVLGGLSAGALFAWPASPPVRSPAARPGNDGSKGSLP
jgi:uncharacterized protein (TIRG00374 family)